MEFDCLSQFEEGLITWYKRRLRKGQGWPLIASQDHKKHAKKSVFTEKGEGDYIHGYTYNGRCSISSYLFWKKYLEIELISKEFSEKKKYMQKVKKMKKLIDKSCKSNIKTVVEKHGWWWIKYTINLFSRNCKTNCTYSSSK